MKSELEKVKNKLYKLSNADIVKLTPYLEEIQPPLTPKQRKFCYYYVISDFNKVLGAKYAGYSCGTKKHGKVDQNTRFRIITNENINKPYLKQAIDMVIEHEIKDKSHIKKKLFDLLWKRANYDIAIFQDDEGEMLPLKDIPKEWRCVIDGTERKHYGKDGLISVVVAKLADRDKAIDKLDKYIQMTKEPDKGGMNELTDETMSELLDFLHRKN